MYPNNSKDKHYEQIIGAIIIYILVMMIIPYFLFKYAPFVLFITWFANVDIVSNILTIGFPNYFKNVYNINSKTLLSYISYNIISLVALSGIFMAGIKSTNQTENDFKTFAKMVIMSIVTWVLPTQGIPYLTKKTIQRVRHTELHKTYPKLTEIVASSLISVSFIILEAIIIKNFIPQLKTRK